MSGINPGPLGGIKVLDLSRYIAGPYCAALLGDFGADVVKAEKHGFGDDARHYGPPIGDERIYFLTLNRNKRSVEVDFRSFQGKQLLWDLAVQADVLVENFRPGVLEKMGLSPEKLLAANPRLVITRISGFGQTGPESQRLSFDAIAQAESGLMSLTGHPGGPPMPIGAYLVDFTAGLQAANATMMALFERQTSGLGQVVDVSLIESSFSLLLAGPAQYLHSGEVMTRVGPVDRYAAPAGIYPAVDGWVYLVVKGNEHFARLATAMGTPEITADQRFCTPDLRIENRAALDVLVGAFTATKQRDALLAEMEAADLPCAPVNSIGEAVSTEQMAEREAMVTVAHESLGDIQIAGVVAKLTRTPGGVRLAPPLLGQHNDDVRLDWLGG